MTHTPKLISDYMRSLQRKSAQARWSKLTPKQRARRMRPLARVRYSKLTP